MKIQRISLYKVELPFMNPFRISGGRVVTRLDDTVVRIETDTDTIGWGETCPWGPDYLPAFAEAARAGLSVLAPALLGEPADNLGRVHAVMDRTLNGQAYIKAAIDMACWDLLGQSLGVALHALLGGRQSQSLGISMRVSDGPDEGIAARMLSIRQHGVRQFSVKASGLPDADVVFLEKLAGQLETGESIKMDANCGWKLHEAIQVMRAAPGAAVLFEQPCASYEACAAAHRATGRPIILDEIADNLRTLVRAFEDGVLAGVNLKIARHGGIGRSRTVRDMLVELGVPYYVQCTGGSELTNAAIAHLACSAPEGNLIAVWSSTDALSQGLASGGPVIDGSRMHPTEVPGLGPRPEPERLGASVAEFSVD